MNKSDISAKALKITLWLQNGYMLFMYAPNLSFLFSVNESHFLAFGRSQLQLKYEKLGSQCLLSSQ